jgi:hypothetical protein
MAQHPGVTTQEAALAIMDGAVDESATKLGTNVKLLRAPVASTGVPMNAAIGSGEDPVRTLWHKIHIPRAPNRSNFQLTSEQH